MAAESLKIHQGWISRLADHSFFVLASSFGLPQISFPLFGQELQLPDILFFLAGALWVIPFFFGQRRIIFHSFYWPLAGYIAALAISALFSVDPPRSLSRFPQELYLICLAILAINFVTSTSHLKRTVIAWLAGSAIAVLIGLVSIGIFYLAPGSPLLEQLTYHYGSVPVGNYPRVTAGFVSASMLCNYLNVSFIFSLLSINQRWLPRTLALTLLIGEMAAAVFTVSIGLGGLVLAFGIWFWLSNDRKDILRRLALASGIFTALTFLAISFFALASYPGAQVMFTVPLVDVTLLPSARMLVWHDALNTFMSHPLTGIGLGLPVADVVFTNTDGSLSLLTDAHDSFLSVAAQSGILGLAAFVVMVFAITRRWLKDTRVSRTVSIVSAVGLAFICSFIYQGLTGSFEDARHLWMLIGVFWAADQVENIEA
jgi:O-antigen ligase